ncbi:hypothetical protein Bpfe_011164, partial [Biomphalaria pfeifferi]
TYQKKKAHQDISCTPWTINKGQGWTIDQQGTNKSDIVWKCANGCDEGSEPSHTEKKSPHI